MNRRLMPPDADAAERDPLVRREVIVVPGGVLTVTVFHFDRRAYIVCLRLQKAILSLLDALDSSAAGEGRADIVINGGGVITGYFLGDGSPENMYQRLCHGEVAD